VVSTCMQRRYGLSPPTESDPNEGLAARRGGILMSRSSNIAEARSIDPKEALRAEGSTELATRD
jgi:hypothetical protein